MITIDKDNHIFNIVGSKKDIIVDVSLIIGALKHQMKMSDNEIIALTMTGLIAPFPIDEEKSFSATVNKDDLMETIEKLKKENEEKTKE